MNILVSFNRGYCVCICVGGGGGGGNKWKGERMAQGKHPFRGYLGDSSRSINSEEFPFFLANLLNSLKRPTDTRDPKNCGSFKKEHALKREGSCLGELGGNTH